MKKKRHCNGFLGCRTTKKMEAEIKAVCDEHNKGVSEVMNYLFRIFLEDLSGIRTKFFGGNQ